MSSEELRDSIAIIGMAGRFPGADTLDTFWQNLCQGVESVSFFADQELERAVIDPDEIDDPSYVRARAVLRDVEQFDAGFFDLTPREAELTDPQHRIFLECAWEALERAGYDPDRYPGLIGIYGGAGANTYLLFHLAAAGHLVGSAQTLRAFLHNKNDHLTTRVAYKLNLRGPALTVQTACSTSLVAVSLACQSLLNYQTDMALAGGVTITVPQQTGYLYHERGIGSPDGHCRPFDARAQGTVGGNGAGVVLLKRYEDALNDGDTILALIRGAAVNNDGALRAGYTAPNVDTQAEVIGLTQALAGVDPATIGYIEAHGTGTPIGDPIEVQALTQAFRRGTERRQFCALGAVKANIGHLDSAAGIAGLIKTVLVLRHRQIPPSPHYERPNPAIDFADSPFYVTTRLCDWPDGAAPRRAGVSSFGMGGTNAHVVLEEAPPRPSSGPARPLHLLLLSGKTASAMERASLNLVQALRDDRSLNLADVAYTLEVGRKSFAHRRMLVCRDRDDAIATLAALVPERVFTHAQEPARRPLTFLFPGQGAQHVGMAAELYQAEPRFRVEVDRCAEILRPHLGLDIRAVIFGGERPPTTDQRPAGGQHALSAMNGVRFTTEITEKKEDGAEPDALAADHVLAAPSPIPHPSLPPVLRLPPIPLDETWLAQPALFVVEYALARLWMAWGVQPHALIGHSIGEYVAAHLADVFSLEDALALVAARGRLIQRLPQGAMLAVPLAEHDLRRQMVELGDAGAGLALAAVNSLAQCVVSGPMAAVAALERHLTAREVICRRLRTSHAFHSAMMEPAVEPFAALVRAIALHPPQMPYLSNVTGTWITAEQATDPAYWARHLRATVRFADGLAELLQAPDAVLLEVGPGHALRTLARWHPHKKPDQVMLATLPGRGGSEQEHAEYQALLGAVGQLWLAGIALDWTAFYEHEQRQRVILPTYPFDRQRYWIDLPRGRSGRPPATVGRRADLGDWFAIPSWEGVPLAGAGAPPAEDWLLLLDGGSLGEQVARRLEAVGQRVVRARPGESFRAEGDGSYALRPAAREDYAALLAALRAVGRLPRRVAHLWSLASVAATVDVALERGLLSLIALAQALGGEQLDAPTACVVVTHAAQEVVGGDLRHPAQACVLGPCLVIPREYPCVACRSIDVALPSADSWQERELVEHLTAELCGPTDGPTVAYRGGRRWEQRFAPLRLPAAAPDAGLRPGGVYLITGGLGGIGLTIAADLAQAVHARLVLIGRSVPPSREQWDDWLATHAPDDLHARQIRAVREIERVGAQVLIVHADVTDEAQVRAALAQAQAHFGPLHGVIHAAGVSGGGMIHLKEPHEVARVLAPKLEGTQVLARLLADTPLDFFLLQSSLTTVVGRLGQVDYSAANAYLDAFACYERARSGRFVSAVSWGTWGQVGMAARPEHTAPPADLLDRAAAERLDHPLLERRIALAPGREVYLTDFNVDKHWVLDEHRILGNPVIPGVAYFEMVRAALGARAEGRPVEFQDVFFVAPLRVPDGETREVRLVLEQHEDAYRFAIRSATGVGAETLRDFTIGGVRIGAARPLNHYDLAAIRARCDVEEILLAEEQREEDLGPRWHTVQRVYIGHNEVMLVMELPEAFVGDFAAMKFHPALLDRAAGIAKNFLAKDDHYLPLTYKSLKINAPLQRKIYSYARFREEESRDRETITFDIVLLNEVGEGLVEISGFSQKRVNDPAIEIRALAEAPRVGASASAPEAPDAPRDDLIAPREGVAALRRILAARTAPRVIVSPRDLQVVMAQTDDEVRERILDAVAAQPRPSQQLHPRPNLAASYVAPESEVERQIAAVWQSVLGIEHVGIHDNFFELGGDSLIAIQVISRLEREMQTTIPPVAVFEGATIHALARLISPDAVEQTVYDERQSRGEERRSRMLERRKRI